MVRLKTFMKQSRILLHCTIVVLIKKKQTTINIGEKDKTGLTKLNAIYQNFVTDE